MKYVSLSALLVLLVLCTSCEGQNKSEAQKDNVQSETKDVVESTGSYHTQYVYTDSDHRRVIIQNSYPRGELYTGADGQQYTKVVFWTRIINETNNALKLAIDFSGDDYESAGSAESSVVKYCKLIIPPDTMTSDKEGLRNYGLIFDLTDFGKPSSLNRTVDPNDSSGFFVLKLYKISEEDRALVKRGGGGAARAGFSVKGQDVFWTLNGKAIPCGTINLNLK